MFANLAAEEEISVTESFLKKAMASMDKKQKRLREMPALDADHLDLQCQLDDHHGRISVFANFLAKYKKVAATPKGKLSTTADTKALEAALEEVSTIMKVPNLFTMTDAKLKLDKLQKARDKNKFLETLQAVCYDPNLPVPPEEFAEDSAFVRDNVKQEAHQTS